MKRSFLAILALVLVPVALYARVARFDYVQADDIDLIRDNQLFLRDLGNIPRAFARSYFDIAGQPAGPKTYYRPLVILSFMLDAQVGGDAPLTYHLTNLGIHVAAILLLFVLLRRLGAASVKKVVPGFSRGVGPGLTASAKATAAGATDQGDLRAFLLALVFAVHPANTQAICWIPGRNDTLMALFALLSVIGLVVHLEAPKGRASAWPFWLHVGGFGAALFTKEAALALLGLFVLYAAFWARRLREYRRNWRLLGAYAIVLIGWYVLRRRALSGGSEGMAAADYAETLLRNAPDLLGYLGKIVLPFHLNVMPGLTAIDAWLGLASLALIGWMLLHVERGKRMFVIGWVVLFLMPALLLPGLPAYEHRLYFPLMGIVVAASQLHVWSVATRRRVTIAVAVGVQAIFAAVAFAHTGVFRDRYAYWSSATRGTPHAGIAHVNLGRMYESDGDHTRAAEHYRDALARDPLTPGAHNNLGTLLARQGDLPRAKVEFEREVALHPANADAHYNLGLVYKLAGRVDDAVPWWQRTIAIDPYYAAAFRELVEYYAARGDSVQAAAYLEQLKALEAHAPH